MQSENNLTGEDKILVLDNFKGNQKEKIKQLRNISQPLKAKSEIQNYLNLHNLYFETDEIEGIPYITMAFKTVTGVRDISRKAAFIFMRNVWKCECITRRLVLRCVINLRIYLICTD